MKFFTLFKKELRDLITIQSLIGIFASVIVFVLLGNFMGSMGEEMSKNLESVVIADNDNSALSAEMIDAIKDAGMEVFLIEGEEPNELTNKAFEKDEHLSVLVFEKGFEENINKEIPANIRVVLKMKSFSMMSGSDKSAESAFDIVKNSLSEKVISAGSGNATFIKDPIKPIETTVVGEKYQNVNSSILASFAMQQSIFIPIIVFLLITFASQLNVAAIANEKNDKTLETLLSAPVPRLAVLGSKMCASGVFSLLMAGVYMIGFSSYMGGMMGGMSGGAAAGTAQVSDALAELGLKMTAGDYVLLGVQLFLTILIALAVSMIIGALAKDMKAAQSLIAPLMFMTMIPYFITMMTDVNSLPTVAKVLVYIIPFTHTFTASTNILFDNNLLFFGGCIYQLVLLVIILFIAVRIFSTDKIFTMTLEFKKKKKAVTNSDK